jgi:hypothetical protein
MSLIFDQSLTAKFTKVTFTGDFSVILPTFSFDDYNSSHIIIGSDNDRGYLIASSSNGRLTFYFPVSGSVSTAGSLAAGVDHSGVTLSRTGDVVTLTTSAESVTATKTGPISFNIWGGRDGLSGDMDGTMSGTGTISGTGVDTITHDFDYSTGTTLTDTTGTNDGTLQNVVSGGFQAPPTTNPLTIVSQPKNNKVIPRASTTDGLFSKGEGTHVFNATADGALEYRIVDQDGTTEVVTWASFTTGVDFTVTVPANTQWYKLELRSSVDLADTTLSNQFTCGGVTLVSGQSLAVRMFKSLDDTTDISTLSITPSAYQMTLASYEDSVTKYPAAWLGVTASGDIDSAFSADFLNRKVAQEGVSWALVGHTAGGSSIGAYADGTARSNKLFEIITEVGGFHEFIWFQGHTDSRDSTHAIYKPKLQDLYNRVAAANLLASFDYYSLSIPNIGNSDWGNTSDIAANKRAHKEVADENGGLYIGAYDIKLAADNVHQDQQGNLDLSRSIFRAQYGEFIGPHFDSFTRVGANINIKFNFKSGGDALVAVGNPIGVISVATLAAPWTLIEPSSITVNATDIDIVTPTDLGTDDLVIWFGSGINNDGSTSIRDNYTADGFSVGRGINGTVAYTSGAFIYNEDLSTFTSTANITITGIPDGDHYIFLNDDTHTQIYSGLVTFAAEAATLPALPLLVGVRYYGYWKGSNTPTDGSGITGITV